MDISKIVAGLGFESQSELARAYGVSPGAVHQWKLRGIKDAVKRRLETLATERGVNPETLGLDS